ncbi:hypothetical protein GA0116948_109124 [Chitinophaga costaii]|uniref:Uncharacterized protein n=1 Tax=Chitinophaga costaii TaxID=1335309 RepID=A0A1C4EQW4_9BACT|nr:hypothetical protein [Chitinophaga costaii]SCC45922.1 hypothetical protein GA0116948_109124 [Chitinophaga costaii]
MVELEDIRIGNYFAHQQKVITISAEHYQRISILAAELEPLRLIPQKFFSLGFGTIRAQDFNGFTKSCNNVEVFLRAAPQQRWTLQVGNTLRVRSIEHVHELQNVWYWLFGESLKRARD